MEDNNHPHQPHQNLTSPAYLFVSNLLHQIVENVL
jgi:hypothetical protein